MSDPDSRSTLDQVKKDAVRIPDPGRLGETEKVGVIDDAVIVVTQVFCHNRHPLVEASNTRFGGFPGVKLHVGAEGRDHTVVLSPLHGHHERTGGDEIPPGTQCSVRCPLCDEDLPVYTDCNCGRGKLRAMYLTPDVDEGFVVAVCDVWGCQRSRIVDEFEILSEFVEGG